MNLQVRPASSESRASKAFEGRLLDKVAVITGASSGIGKAIALVEAARHSIGRRLPNHAGRAPPDVQAEEWQHYLHGFGSLEGGITAEGALCDSQARHDRVG